MSGKGTAEAWRNTWGGLGGIGDQPPAPQAPPPAPSIGDETQKAEEEKRKNMGQGMSANMLAGDSSGYNSSSSRNVLLGS